MSSKHFRKQSLKWEKFLFYRHAWMCVGAGDASEEQQEEEMAMN